MFYKNNELFNKINKYIVNYRKEERCDILEPSEIRLELRDKILSIFDEYSDTFNYIDNRVANKEINHPQMLKEHEENQENMFLDCIGLLFTSLVKYNMDLKHFIDLCKQFEKFVDGINKYKKFTQIASK